MLRAILDANVFVSAYVRPEGPPGQIVQRFLQDAAFALVLSEELAVAVLKALAYPKVLKSAILTTTSTSPGPSKGARRSW